MLSTLEDNYALISNHAQRIRDLTEQASNGTYGTASLSAIRSEIMSRMDEIDRIAANCEFNGQYMMNNSMSSVAIQVGLDGEASKSQISLDNSLFSAGDAVSLFTAAGATGGKDSIATACTGCDENGQRVTTADPAAMLDKIDKVMNTISGRITKIGAAQNRIESAIDSIAVQSENITSSLSTLRDADVASESSNYIKAQILQQASATLLATANQAPSIALNLL